RRLLPRAPRRTSPETRAGSWTSRTFGNTGKRMPTRSVPDARCAARRATLTVALVLSACAGCHADGAPHRGDVEAASASTRVANTVAPASSSAQSGPMTADAGDFIGVATMEADGTIVLNLRAEGPGEMVGHGQLRYPPGHKDYQDVLAHLGDLKPGESKPV